MEIIGKVRDTEEALWSQTIEKIFSRVGEGKRGTAQICCAQDLGVIMSVRSHLFLLFFSRGANFGLILVLCSHAKHREMETWAQTPLPGKLSGRGDPKDVLALLWKEASLFIDRCQLDQGSTGFSEDCVIRNLLSFSFWLFKLNVIAWRFGQTRKIKSSLRWSLLDGLLLFVASLEMISE